MIDLDKCRNAMPLPELMAKLGYKNHVGKSVKCPWHKDKNPSFSVYEHEGRWFWKCWSGCGKGDEIDFIKRITKLETPDAIKHYAELAGVKDNGVRADKPRQVPVLPEDSAGSTPAPPTFIPLKAGEVEQLAKWRGLSLKFVSELNESGHIGKFIDHNGKHCIAFPVIGGLHYRKPDQTWRYTEGAKPSLFILNDSIEEGADVHCFESQWDALVYADAREQRDNIVATRGASNIKLLTDRLCHHSGTLYLWPQNDGPGQKWADEIRKALPDEQIKVAKVPDLRSGMDGTPNIKDLNEWRKAGATDGDILSAFIDAKEFVGAEQPSRVGLAGSIPALEAQSCANKTAESKGSDTAPTSNFPVPVLAEPLNSAMQEPSSASSSREAREGNIDKTVSLRVGRTDSRGGEKLSDTLDSIVMFVSKYVIFPDDEQARAVALWVAHAWTFTAFRFSPYLNISSPEMRCGKTTLLELLHQITPNPVAMVLPTEAVLFRTIDDPGQPKPTLFLDEIDAVYGKDATDRGEGVRAVLNVGFQSGPMAIIRRCIGKNNKPEPFNTFCPKVIAGIGKNLPDTVRDRSIDIRLVRQTKTRQGAVYRQRDVETEVVPIRSELTQWSASQAMLDTLTHSRPEMPNELMSRQRDMCEPLLAVADMAGGEWPEAGRTAITAIFARYSEHTTGTQLLGDCRDIFDTLNLDKITTEDLLESLMGVQSADSPWPSWWGNDLRHNPPNIGGPAQKLAKLLGAFEIAPHNIRTVDAMGRSTVTKGYSKKDFEDSWNRYLEPPKGMATMSLPLEMGT